MHRDETKPAPLFSTKSQPGTRRRRRRLAKQPVNLISLGVSSATCFTRPSGSTHSHPIGRFPCRVWLSPLREKRSGGMWVAESLPCEEMLEAVTGLLRCVPRWTLRPSVLLPGMHSSARSRLYSLGPRQSGDVLRSSYSRPGTSPPTLASHVVVSKIWYLELSISSW